MKIARSFWQRAINFLVLFDFECDIVKGIYHRLRRFRPEAAHKINGNGAKDKAWQNLIQTKEGEVVPDNDCQTTRDHAG